MFFFQESKRLPQSKQKKKGIEEIKEQLQINSTAIKTKIADLRAQLVRQLAKSNAKKSGITVILLRQIAVSSCGNASREK